MNYLHIQSALFALTFKVTIVDYRWRRVAVRVVQEALWTGVFEICGESTCYRQEQTSEELHGCSGGRAEGWCDGGGP